MNLKTIKQSETKKLGKLVYRFDLPWKVSALAEIGNPLQPIAMVYNNVSRHNSEIWIKSGRIYSDDAAETLGQPIIYGDYMATMGECGYAVYSHKGSLPTRHFKLDWASTCNIYNGKAIVIDQRKDKKNYVRDLLSENGDILFQMPGNYIALDSCVWQGLLWAAVGWDQGLSCSNGRLYKAKFCHCSIVFRDNLYFTSGNKILTFGGDKVVTLGELPCEKIMHMISVNDEYVHIAGGNPDTAWRYDMVNGLTTLGTITGNTVKEIGGQCFGWRISQNYYARTFSSGQKADNGRDMDCGEVYEII